VNIEPYSNVGLELSGRFPEDQDYIIFNSPYDTSSFFQTGKDTFDIHFVINALLSKLPAIEYDERVTKIVEYITTNYFEQDITPKRLLIWFSFLRPVWLGFLKSKQAAACRNIYYGQDCGRLFSLHFLIKTEVLPILRMTQAFMTFLS